MHHDQKFTHPAAIGSALVVALALIVAVVLTIPGIAEAHLGAKKSPKAHSAASTASVRVTACESAPLYADRKIEFSGRMTALPIVSGGTLQMRFDVLRKFSESRRWRSMRAEGLRTWVSSTDPATTVFVRNISLAQIETAAQYRARVSYRWKDENGDVVAKASRKSRVCKQHAQLPDIVPAGFVSYPTPGASTTTYVVRVSNQSKSEAINVPVAITIDGQTPFTRTIDSLMPKQTFEITLDNVATCTGSVTIEVNVGRKVRERPGNARRNNVQVLPCH